MNSSNVEGVLDQAKGKLKQAAGEAFDNQKLANEGAADEVKGHAKEAWGNLKDTANEIGSRHAAEAHVETDNSAHNLRESITHTAADAKESINRGLDHLKSKH
jgi:uncharacterized protein YjbJ (UPF0337 family)